MFIHIMLLGVKDIMRVEAQTDDQTYSTNSTSEKPRIRDQSSLQ